MTFHPTPPLQITEDQLHSVEDWAVEATLENEGSFCYHEDEGVLEAWAAGYCDVTGHLPDGRELNWQFPWDAYPEDTHSLEAAYDMQPKVDWNYTGCWESYPRNFVIVDEDGDVDDDDTFRVLLGYAETTLPWESEATDTLPTAPEPEGLDTGEDEGDTDMQKYTVQRDGEPDIRFTGELLAEVSSMWTNGRQQNRWTELELYRLRDGRYVAVTIGRTQWQGEHDRHDAQICSDLEEVKAAFGFGWLAKELYEAAEIDAAQDLDSSAVTVRQAIRQILDDDDAEKEILAMIDGEDRSDILDEEAVIIHPMQPGDSTTIWVNDSYDTMIDTSCGGSWQTWDMASHSWIAHAVQTIVDAGYTVSMDVNSSPIIDDMFRAWTVFGRDQGQIVEYAYRYDGETDRIIQRVADRGAGDVRYFAMPRPGDAAWTATDAVAPFDPEDDAWVPCDNPFSDA